MMKKAGLIGGMGPQSTMPYYMGVVYGVNERTRPDFFPNITVESINVFEVLDYCAREDYAGLTNHLLGAVEALARSGADFAALTANTAHIVFDRLQAVSPIPLISIVEATCAEAMRRKVKRVALLGTVFTSTRDFYKLSFIREGIQVIIPNAEEMSLIDKRITSELEYGIIRQETLAEFQKIIARMRDEDKAETVILGCTELPLLLNDANSPLPVLDTVAIHTRAIVDAILS